MNTLVVDLGDRSYPIKIGRGLFGDPVLLTAHIRGRQVMIVSNSTVGYHVGNVLSKLGTNNRTEAVTMAYKYDLIPKP